MAKEWRDVRLGEICNKPQYGFTASAENIPDGPKFLRITDITELGVNWDTVPHCQCPTASIASYRLEHNDILVARIGATTGKSFIVKCPPLAVFASYLIRFKAHPDICPDFLFYFLHTDDYWSQVRMNKDKNLKGGVNATVLSGLTLSLPSPPEQKKISVVLLKIQQAIEPQENIIQSLSDLKKSTMQQLFTYGLRGEKTKMTEIGEIPESWEVKKIEDFLKESIYGLSIRGQIKGNYPILRMNCQIDGMVVFDDLQFVDLDAKMFEKFRLMDGDLLFNRTNSHDLVGRMAVYHSDHEAVFASYLIRLRLDQLHADPDFVNYYFNRNDTQARIKTLASRGVSQSNISASKLKTFEMPLPSNLDEQTEVAGIFKEVDGKVRMHELKKSCLQDLFKTTLNKLMTGKIRANDLNIDTSEVEE